MNSGGRSDTGKCHHRCVRHSPHITQTEPTKIAKMVLPHQLTDSSKHTLALYNSNKKYRSPERSKFPNKCCRSSISSYLVGSSRCETSRRARKLTKRPTLCQMSSASRGQCAISVARECLDLVCYCTVRPLCAPCCVYSLASPCSIRYDMSISQEPNCSIFSF